MSVVEHKRVVISAPKIFENNTLAEFLTTVAPLFTWKDRTNVLLDLSKVKKASIINLLVFSKIIEHSYEHSLLLFPKWNPGVFAKQRLDFFGFTSLLDAYIGYSDDEKILRRLEVAEKDGFLIAPQALLRSDKTFKSKLKENYLPGIRKYYESRSSDVTAIFTCLSEISLNFWAHATDDSKSILMAYGNKNKIEIGCADNGQGIVSTLRLASGNRAGIQTNEQILRTSIERGVTSKLGTDHMGYGLWMVSEIAKNFGGTLSLYSEGVYLHNRSGKIETGKCGHWPGTIVYLSLPLGKVFSLSELFAGETVSSVKINWG